MAADIIKVVLTPDYIVELTSDSPDVKSLVDTITKNRDLINPEKIDVKCDNHEFDVESFAEVIQDLVRDYLEAIRLEQESLESELKILRGGVE